RFFIIVFQPNDSCLMINDIVGTSTYSSNEWIFFLDFILVIIDCNFYVASLEKTSHILSHIRGSHSLGVSISNISRNYESSFQSGDKIQEFRRPVLNWINEKGIQLQSTLVFISVEVMDVSRMES